MFQDIYKNKKVFITGHTGFKGSWLSLWLLELGAKVKGYSLEPYTADDHYNLLKLENSMESVIGDVRDLDKLKLEIKKFNPDYIFHLAAQPLVRDSYINPVYTYDVNVMGTVNVLEASRGAINLKSIINVTTDKCYENIERVEGYKEHEPMGGYDPYSSSKGCSELVTSSFRRSFYNSHKENNVPLVATARAGNVIGGGDWCKDRIMTDTFTSLLSNKSIEVRNPDAVRPWQHVLEPLSGYLWLGAQAELANKADFSEAWNFGPELEELVSVKKVVQQVIKIWGSGSWKDTSSAEQLHEAKLLHLDITKAKEKLKWAPSLSVDESIGMTVDWYKKYSLGNKMREVSLNQIAEYSKIALQKNIAWAKA
jgi:CDP-glucose 4,6-dehydratase